MELLLELAAPIFQFLLELLLQFLFEILAEFGLEAVREVIRPTKPSRPALAAVGYALLGAALGGISLLIFPHKFAVSTWLQLLNVVASPAIVGGAMVGIGRWRRQRNQRQLLLHKFWFGSLLALVFAIVRLIFAA